MIKVRPSATLILMLMLNVQLHAQDTPGGNEIPDRPAIHSITTNAKAGEDAGAILQYGAATGPYLQQTVTIPAVLINCVYAKIGRNPRFPAQASTAMIAANETDARACLERDIGSTRVFGGMNNISGQSRIDLEELLEEGHLLISRHTRTHLRSEHFIPGPVIDRANRSRWKEEGSPSLRQRARHEVDELLRRPPPEGVPDDVKRELISTMEREAARHGQAALPGRTV